MAAPTPLFTSARERRLWLWSLAVVAAIYSTLGLAGSLAARLREDNLMSAAVFVLMILTVATIVGSGLRRRPGRRELWVGLGLTAVYGMAVLRMGVGPEERTHLFEYGVVAVLIGDYALELTAARLLRHPPVRDRPALASVGSRVLNAPIRRPTASEGPGQSVEPASADLRTHDSPSPEARGSSGRSSRSRSPAGCGSATVEAHSPR